jgi:ABC-type branched-subunit amino acid transport system substrate-binding protein
VAKEILRGVADAQHEFNSQGGYKGRLLEIIIANDENAKTLVKTVAKHLANQKDILGVLGHQASESAGAALESYEKSKLALVSGTSSSSKLNHEDFPNFFRTISSTKSAAEIYTQYITEYLSLKKIAIFYAEGSLYSGTLRDDIEKAFQGEKKRICLGDVKNPDSKDCQLDIPRQLALLRKDNYKAAFLISSVKTNSVALAIARYNLQLPKESRLHLIGAMALSETATVEKGGEAVEGMTIVSPCTPSSAYMTDSAKRWQQKKIQWRTATTYDAAQALIAAIKKSGDNPTREKVLKNLPFVSLSPQETSGVAVNWPLSSEALESKSNLNRKYCLAPESESNLNRKYCLYVIKDGIFKEKYLNKINNNERD